MTEEQGKSIAFLVGIICAVYGLKLNRGGNGMVRVINDIFFYGGWIVFLGVFGYLIFNKPN